MPDASVDVERCLKQCRAYSPYLTRLAAQHPTLVQEIKTLGPDKVCEKLFAEKIAASNQAELMQNLRIAKQKLALLVALADLSGIWNLAQVTETLSDFADSCLTRALDFLLLDASKRGEIERPKKENGIIILGLGKLGGRELNYSSDIDLIFFFEKDATHYKGKQNEQKFMNKLAHELVNIMQERTRDGYVFRTDLRLRPDPASTPPAISIAAAFSYYESVGQNWERAALIKARPIAGDIKAGEKFLEGLRPYLWRKHLDFAAINDIHSIKRQMDTRQNRAIELKGHNIKLGLGGIREIEFYAQIHQLIWGGREPAFRTRATCETLAQLATRGLIDAATESTLKNAYEFLRTLEHRLQMIADEQTHSLPETDEGIANVAHFMGYDSVEKFSRELLAHLECVHAIYASSFKSADKLGAEGNLVFTGVSHDPDTLATLSRMGYCSPETISEIVMGWHHGGPRATRSKRARELLTELMPALLKALSETANPEAAFIKFNDFLTRLPAGVQLFSLFSQNPQLLSLIADILGSAPLLAEYLSRSPSLLDAVLFADFYGPLPPKTQLVQQLNAMLATARDFEERMDNIHRFRNEKQFQAGVQLLKNMVAANAAEHFLSDLADLSLEETYHAIATEFSKQHGVIPGGNFAIIALGKLGSREMNFGSDIDLVFVYDTPNPDAMSDGKKRLSASEYYNRLAQRLIGALTAPSRDGRLYEVDTRLRPSGEQGLLAVSVSALHHYFSESAWTFEFMALAKARVAMAEGDLHASLTEFIHAQLARAHDEKKLRRDALDMRARIEKENGRDNIWDLKYVRGGLVDIDFIAQYWLLRQGGAPGSATEILRALKPNGAGSLIESAQFLDELFNRLRLCSDGAFDEKIALPGLKKLLCEAVNLPDFDTLKARLIAVEANVAKQYDATFNI